MNSKALLFTFLIFNLFSAYAQKSDDRVLGMDNLDSAVVYLDVDLFGEFHNGLCSVKKGDDIAFINEKGEIVIPFGKFQYQKDAYLLTEDNMPRFSDGLCRIVKYVRDKNRNYWYKYGFINTDGEIIIDYKLKFIGNFVNGFAYQIDTGFFYDKLGNKANPFPVWEKDFEFPEGVDINDFISHVLVPAKMTRNQVRGAKSDQEYYTFYDIFMEPILEGKFIDAGLFHEGLAAVAVLDDSTNEVKWGYINEIGETVIDYQFDHKPGNFSDSLAVVYVDSLSQLSPKIGFINPQGELELIIPYQEGKYPQWTPLNFYGGQLVLWESRGFKSYNKNKEITRGLRIKDVCGKYFYDIGRPVYPIRKIKDQYVLVSSAKSPCGKRGLIAYTLDGKLLMPPTYGQFGKFGERSGLAKITHVSKTRQFVEGFINMEGNFVIIKGKAPKE